jgi:gluconate 5-dehydrogenase
VEDDFGRIDILVHHAAVKPRVPLLDMDEWDWHRVLDVNLTGAFLMTQSAGRLMRAQGSGVIIHLVQRTKQNETQETAFAASMAGVDALARRAAQEFAPYGIQVHSVENVPERIVECVFALFEP